MRSVRTTFQILDAVADHQPVGLSDLARRLQLPKSTVQRSLATLADLGWIRPDGHEVTRWVLGDRVRTLGEKIDDFGRLREVAAPYLDRLNNESLETVHLTVPEVRTMRLIERLDSKHPLRLVKPIGTRSPMHAASTGKAVLAYLSEHELDEYLSTGLEPLTQHTLVDPEQLRTDLKDVRQRGYAVAREELNEGITSVAASIRPHEGRAVAAISISGPSSRMSSERCVAYGRSVAAAVAQIAERLR